MKPRILFIDDDRQWLQAYQGLLEDEGYDVVTATNAFDAVFAAETLTDLNMFLTDLSLPPEDGAKPDGEVGLALLDSLRNKRPDVPIIVLSAYLERYAKDLGKLGVSAFISKGSPNAIEDIKVHTRKVIKDNNSQVRKEVDEASTLASLRQLIVGEINKYSPIIERTILVPKEGQFELIKPLVGYKREIESQLARFPFSKNVFLMMKFRQSNEALSEYMIENLAKYGLLGIRADHEEWNITKNVYNPIAVLYCCKYGIALFDEPEEAQAYSANVAYEVGMMHYQNKDCLILRHKSLPVMPFDMIKDLYVTYERDLQVREIIAKWITQIAVSP